MSTLLQKWSSKRNKSTNLKESAPSIPAPLYPWSQQKLRNSQRTLPRYGHTAVAHPKHGLIIYGGKHKGHAKKELFSINTGTMTTHIIPANGSLPSQRMYTTIALLDNLVALYGGEPLSSSQQWDPSVYLLNLTTNRWVQSSRHSMGERSGHSMVSNNNTLYIWGGRRSSKAYLGDMNVFQVRNGKYVGCRCITFLPGLAPMPRSNHCSVIFDGKIFIFGGGNHHQLFNDIWSYDISENQWHCISATGFIPSPRHHCAVSLVDGVLYIHGGKDEQGRELHELYGFKIKNSCWYMFQNMGKAPSARFGHTMTPIGSKLYIIGGERTDTSIKQDDSLTIHILDNDKVSYPPDDDEPDTSTARLRRNSSPILPPGDRPPDSPHPSESSPMPSSHLRSLVDPQPSRSTPPPKSIPPSHNLTPSRSSSLQATPLVSPASSSPTEASPSTPIPAQLQPPVDPINLSLQWSNESVTTIRPISTLTTMPIPPKPTSLLNPTSPENLKERTMLLQQIKTRDLEITEMKNKEHWWRTQVAKACGIDKQHLETTTTTTTNTTTTDDLIDFSDDSTNSPTLNDQQIKRLLFEQLVATKTEVRHIKRDIESACKPISIKLDHEERIQQEALHQANHYKALYEALCLQQQIDEPYRAQQYRRVADLESRLAKVEQDTLGMTTSLNDLKNEHKSGERHYHKMMERLDKEHRRAQRTQTAYDATLKRLFILQQRTRINELNHQVNVHHIRLLEEQLQVALRKQQQQQQAPPHQDRRHESFSNDSVTRWEMKNMEQRNVVLTLQQQLVNTNHLVRCLQTDLKKSTCDWSNLVEKLELTRAEIQMLVS